VFGLYPHTYFLLAMAVLIANGVFLIMTNALVQSLIQINVRPDVRARTLGLYTMGHSALQPLGTLGLGITIAAIGLQNGVAVFVLAAMAVSRSSGRSPEIRRG
jgi:hypothetical protein